jgi:hypothetical protein
VNSPNTLTTPHGVYPRRTAPDAVVKSRKRWPRLLHAALFVSLLALWTYLLLRPSPVPESLFDGFSLFDKEMLHFVLAKSLHLGSYAFMAVLGGSLVPAGRWRWAVYTLLVLHGAGSELGQWIGNEYFGTNRHGCVRDVVIDVAGVALGAWVLRWWDRMNSR